MKSAVAHFNSLNLNISVSFFSLSEMSSPWILAKLWTGFPSHVTVFVQESSGFSACVRSPHWQPESHSVWLWRPSLAGQQCPRHLCLQPDSDSESEPESDRHLQQPCRILEDVEMASWKMLKCGKSWIYHVTMSGFNLHVKTLFVKTKVWYKMSNDNASHY